MASCEDEVYVVYDRLSSLKQRLMDPSEGRAYIEPSEPQELPPLYESVNSKDSESTPSPCCSNINRVLIPFKGFYFFFYGAIGSLFPFLALYFRHLWLSPTQAGLLVGLRPIVQSIFGPFWALFADRFNAKKIVLFIGLCGWLFAHTSLLLVPAGKKPLSCTKESTQPVKRSADLRYSLYNNIPYEELDQNPRDRREYNHAPNLKIPEEVNQHVQAFRQSEDEDSRTKNASLENSLQTPNASLPKSSEVENPKEGSEEVEMDSWWTMSSNHVPLDTWHTFTYLFLIILIGNIFAAPAQTMANTATLQALASETHLYGAQRCFGSVGWGIGAFGVGMLVSMNHDSALACRGLDDINYSPCFYAFGVLMLCALVTATLFKFRNADEAKNPHEKLNSLHRTCQQLDCLTLFVFFTTLLAGFNMGFIQTFLFWHLQSLGGTQHLFSIITGFNAVGEMIGFLLSVKLISKYGHLKVLALGIFAYAIRLIVYGVVENPWLVLTVEILKMFTSSAVWSSVMSYVGVRSQIGATLPALAHMLYWGVGYGGGGMLGGVLMQAIGARTIFLGLAVISLTVVILILVIVHLDCLPKGKPDIYMHLESEDEEDEQEESDE